MSRELICGDQASVFHVHAKVTPFPRNLFSQTDATRGDTGNGFFTGEISGGHMQVDTARQIKHPLRRSIDHGFEVDSDHSPCLIGVLARRLEEFRSAWTLRLRSGQAREDRRPHTSFHCPITPRRTPFSLPASNHATFCPNQSFVPLSLYFLVAAAKSRVASR